MFFASVYAQHGSEVVTPWSKASNLLMGIGPQVFQMSPWMHRQVVKHLLRGEDVRCSCCDTTAADTAQGL